MSPAQLAQIQERTRANLNRQTAHLEAEHAKTMEEAAAIPRPNLYTVTQHTRTFSQRRGWTERDQVIATGLEHDQAQRAIGRLGFAGVTLVEEREWGVFEVDSDELLAGPFDDRGECETAQRDLIAHGAHARSICVGPIL